MAYKDIITSCILCGEYSNGYLFCRDCYYEYKDQKILVSIENCEDFEVVDGDIDICDENEETACLACGEDSNGYNFCKSCYYKYKNRTIYLSVKNCEDFEIIDEPPVSPPVIPIAKTGNKFEDSKNKRADDGHMVRSSQEVIIDNVLYSAGISHAYEKPLPYTKLNGKPIVPDWFVPVLKTTKGIYIEYWGVKDNKGYDINRADKEKVYQQENIPVIHIEADETSDTQTLNQKLIMKLNTMALEYYGVKHFVE